MSNFVIFFFFFFQAEDGIRDYKVTGVQTCALPICVAVIFDEVQCGLGRTGTLFAYEQAGVVPDILTLARPLAGGLRVGAVLVTSAVAAALKPGDHATTFGGGPLVAGVALEVVRTIADPAFVAGVRRKAEWLGARLTRLAARAPRVREVRGRGLMWGLELAEPAAPIVAAALERSLLVVTAGPPGGPPPPPPAIQLAGAGGGGCVFHEARPWARLRPPPRPPSPGGGWGGSGSSPS